MIGESKMVARLTQLRAEDVLLANGKLELMNGDEAVAWAAVDAGIRYSSAYPGTPTTDIQEKLESIGSDGIRLVWSINEKVAFESALAVGICGQRSLCSMKQVGVNVAADAIINSITTGTIGGMVLVVGDDPEAHSSPHKQDTRSYRPIAGTILFEPADSQDAYSMTRDAFRVSERFGLPVIVRLTMRTAYGTTPVMRTAPEAPRSEWQWPKQPERFIPVPPLSRKHFLKVADMQPELEQTILESEFGRRKDSSSPDGKRSGVICTGLGYALAREMAPQDYGILKVAGDPFPDAALRSFIEAHDAIAILEEGDPLLESRARAIAGRTIEVKGRMSGALTAFGELKAQEVIAMFQERPRPSLPQRMDLPARLPEICKPCGYHKVFGALKELKDIATPSDMGCNTLGALPPYGVMDGVWAMGSSIGVACGLAAVGHKRIVAIIGDSTFFHAGIPPLIEAIHERHKMTVLLLDNGVAAMTGGQSGAHRCANKTIQQSVDLVRLIEAIGARCTPFDPHKLGQAGIAEMVEKSFEEPGLKVLLYRSQCGLYSPGYFTEAPFSLKKD
jgi:indolepyruvate ferredoxin oxidoreductase alpha subunit